jgi:hypothetical protein
LHQNVVFIVKFSIESRLQPAPAGSSRLQPAPASWFRWLYSMNKYFTEKVIDGEMYDFSIYNFIVK